MNDTTMDTDFDTDFDKDTDVDTDPGAEAYNASVFQENSLNMEKAARMNVLLYPLGGVLIGFGLGAGMVSAGLLKAVATLYGGAVGGYAGYRYGKVRGTELRTQAQAALCLAAIERNTRKNPGANPGSGGKGLFGRLAG